MFNSIPYNPILENGDSSPYFGTYESQKYGPYDTDCCWDFSACELAETRLEMLWKMGLLTQETKDWLTKNGYIDSQGDFYISRRQVAIMSGVKDSGNTTLDFWGYAKTEGLVPNSRLPYDIQSAQRWINKDQFNNDYFNLQAITKDIEFLGVEFAKRFKIQAENLTGGYIEYISTKLQTYLKEGSLQLSIPVPQDGSWNQTYVPYPKGRTSTDHAVELYKFAPEEEYPYYIYDSYEPHLKQLHKDYLIPFITRVSITPLNQSTTPAVPLWKKFWSNVGAWLQKLPFPYPSVPVGRNSV